MDDVPAYEVKAVGVKRAAAMSDLSTWTWRRWAYTGKVASIKAGTRLLIPLSEVHRVLKEGLRPRRRP